MTAPAEALADPVGTVVSLVAAADPALERDLVRRIVEQAGGGRSKRRRLAVELAGNPSVLTTGRSPASKAAGDLMIALRAAGATGISPPWCADCGRRVTSVQRRGEHWYCAPCYVRPEDCAGCGNTRQVAFRDRQGRPRCSKCPDQDAGDPLLALVEVIVMTDPGLPAEAAAAAIEATVTKRAHLQKLAWLLHDKPELLTGDGAKAPFPVVLRLIDALCEAGATRIRRPACPRCRRVIALGKQRDGLRICRNCFARARAVPCAKCGTTREPAARDGQGRPLCSYCLVTDPVNLEECVRCRRRRQVSTRTPAGPVCATCNPRDILTCSGCGRTVPCAVSKLTGQPRCGACARSVAQCSRCGQLATARAGTRDAPLCGNCAARDLGLLKSCPGCRSPGRLIAGACRRCHLRQRLDELLADSAGNVRPELQVLHQTLAAADRPAAVLAWLSSGTPQTMLTELAAGLRPLTHAALDGLPASKPLTHLRSVLVATGALPARDERLIQLEHWITQAVAGRADRQEKEILHRYAVWHVLRRLRQRIRGTHTTSGQAAVARRNIAAAAAFLDWLTARGLTLASCPQGDLDEWTAAASTSQRGPAGHFIRWARNQKLTSLDFPATRWAGPTRVIDAEERWAQARRLLHDGALKPEDRAAGLLVLLYAQQPATISRLTLGHIQATADEVRLRLGREPVVLPEPLAGLILHLAAARRGHATTGDQGTSPWLLPGGRPGQPISPYRLRERLHQIGIQPGPARSTALFQLATELPAAILARMLGIHIDVAVAWQRISAGDWMTYAADVSRRPPGTSEPVTGQTIRNGDPVTLPTRVDRGPVEIVQARHPEDMSPEATRELVNCWMTVANNGGAVGFAFPPVGIDDVSPVADQLIADLDPEYSQLLLAKIDDVLAGWLSLSRYRDRVVPHWGMVKRVQTHPDFRGRGIGSALMHRVRDVAHDELGLEQLRLEARGGEGLEDFYGRLGWQEIGRWPGALRFDHGDRDEVLMLLAPL